MSDDTALVPYEPPVLIPDIVDPRGDAPAGVVHVVVRRNPFRLSDRVITTAPVGMTIAEILEAQGIRDVFEPRVFLDDSLVPVEWWPRVRPRAGHHLVITTVPRGGGGAGGNKGWIGIVLAVAAIAIGIFTQNYFLVAVGVISLVGSIVTAFIAPPSQRLNRLSSADSIAGDRSPSLSGSRNTAALFGPIPRLYGTHRIFPPYAALPYTEFVDNEQFLVQLFCLGYGPLEIGDLKIGDTPLDEFEDVETEIRVGSDSDDPLTLYDRCVYEEGMAVDLRGDTAYGFTGDGPEFIRSTKGRADSISIDIQWPSGLVQLTGAGRVAVSSTIDIWFKRSDESAWHFVTSETETGDVTRLNERRTYAFNTSRPAEYLGTYDVKVRQTGLFGDPTALEPTFNIGTWSALRAIRDTAPFTVDGVATVALRIKATAQLQGVIDAFNCVASSILLDWDSDEEEWVERVTSAPAAVYRDVLQGTANKYPVADERLDLTALQEWAEYSEELNRGFNAILDFRATVFETLRNVAAIGRAAFDMNDGVFSVVRDVPQEVPVQHFSPRNSRKFRGRRVFPDRPHALRVKFINKLAGYTPDEKIVYDDGYDEESATLFEELQLLGVTSPAQAWAEGRYHLVSLRLRPDLWEISTDVEHLVCRRGDLVRVSHDVVSVGLGWGRISAVTADEDGTVTAFELDALVKMVDGTDYGVMIRLPDNRSISRQVVTEAGETQALTLSTSIPGADAPDVGDLVLFGELGSETVDMLVKSIVKVDRDLNATLELVAQAPDIYSADEGDEGTEPPTSMAGLEILVTVFDSPGAFGWNPAANSRIATFELWGGGEPGDEGAGGDGGDGGGGGGYVRFSVSNPSGITGVVGGEDADTTISELSLSAGKGSLGGLATGGDININGGLGDFKVGAVGGHGGDAPQGGSGGRGGVGASVGTAGVIPGGGGGGGSSSAAAGDGAVGMVVVTEYILP